MPSQEDIPSPFLEGRVVNQVIFRASESHDQERTPESVTHQLAHVLMASLLPSRPLWLEEGLAVFLESTRYDRSKQAAVMGEPSELWLEKMSRLGPRRMPLRQLVELETRPKSYAEDTSFSVSAGLLTHHLMNHEGKRFADYQRGLAQHVESRAAWSRSFGDIEHRLRHDLWVTQTRPRYAVATVPLRVPPMKFSIRPVAAPASMASCRKSR